MLVAALTTLSLAIALAAAEVVTRLAYRDITTTADNRSYFASRWLEAHAAEIDADHFRNGGYAEHPEPGVTRIAVIGDSFTFGQGIEIGERLTNRIETELNRRSPRRFEVLNFGKTGQRSVDEIETLRRVLADADPDFVLIQWFVNDGEGPKEGQPQRWRLVPSDRLANFLKRRSALYFLLDRAWVGWQLRRGWFQSFSDYLLELLGDPNSAASLAATRAFEELLTMPRAAGVGVAAFLYPQLESVDGDPLRFSEAFLIDRTLDSCRRVRVRCLDLRPSLGQLQPPEKRWVNMFDHHPNGEANRVAAQAVLEAFEQEWLALASRDSVAIKPD